jgi:hypothetical protein
MNEENDHLPPGFLKSKLGDYKSELPQNAWGNLEKKLNDKRRRRIIIWWMLPLLTFTIVGVGLFVIYKPTTERKPGDADTIAFSNTGEAKESGHTDAATPMPQQSRTFTNDEQDKHELPNSTQAEAQELPKLGNPQNLTPQPKKETEKKPTQHPSNRTTKPRNNASALSGNMVLNDRLPIIETIQKEDENNESEPRQQDFTSYEINNATHEQKIKENNVTKQFGVVKVAPTADEKQLESTKPKDGATFSTLNADPTPGRAVVEGQFQDYLESRKIGVLTDLPPPGVPTFLVLQIMADSIPDPTIIPSGTWSLNNHIGAIVGQLKLDAQILGLPEMHGESVPQLLFNKSQNAGVSLAGLEFFKTYTNQTWHFGIGARGWLYQQQLQGALQPSLFTPVQYEFSTDSLSLIAKPTFAGQEKTFRRLGMDLSLVGVIGVKPFAFPLQLRCKAQLLGANFNWMRTDRNFFNTVELGFLYPLRSEWLIQCNYVLTSSGTQVLPLNVSSSGKMIGVNLGLNYQFGKSH